MVAGPHGKVYVGSYPDYGLFGGAISVYDPKKNERRVYRHIVRNQSIASLAYIEKIDLIAAGSSVRGGSGTRAVEKEARTILSLASTKEGMVYGITENGKVFVFDAQKKEIKKVFDLGFKNPVEIS